MKKIPVKIFWAAAASMTLAVYCLTAGPAPTLPEPSRHSASPRSFSLFGRSWAAAHPFPDIVRWGGSLRTRLPTGPRILVIAPHPDDETLGAGGLIQEAVRNGKEIRVVLVTTGDGYRHAAQVFFQKSELGPSDFRALGIQRHHETLAALRILGVPSHHVLFLGYPDGGTNSLWENNWSCGNLHRGLNGADHAPYPFAYEPRAPYCGENLARNLDTIIRRFQPTDVVYPDPEDQHHDHWAVNAFVKYVLAQMHVTPHEILYLVHRKDWPVPQTFRPEDALLPPDALRYNGSHWFTLLHSASEEQQKRLAVDHYVSQVQTAAPFLYAFIRRNDLAETYTDRTLPKLPAPVPVAGFWRNDANMVVNETNEAGRRRIFRDPSVHWIAIRSMATASRFLIGLQTEGALRSDALYRLELRLFGATPQDPAVHLHLAVQGRTLAQERKTMDGRSLPSWPVVFRTEPDGLIFDFPGSVLKGISSFLVGAETVLHGHVRDRTGWRLIKVVR
jgi:N-acetyl-1-D-myo-inositol-2-amino-2-deoxy-alpha-D-glucopyranoside deacetylase